MKFKILFFVTLFFANSFLFNNLIAQLKLMPASGTVGKEMQIIMSFEADSTLSSVSEMQGVIHLTNPTLFYPERFVAASAIGSSELIRVNDSTYNFKIKFLQNVTNDTLLGIAGEALAGNDSVGFLIIDSLVINNKKNNSLLQAKITTQNIGSPLFYTRYSTLEQNYPNPVNRGKTTTWAYKIDKKMRVIFHIYNLIGEEFLADDLGILDHGVYKYTLNVDRQLPMGAYFIRLEAENNSATQVMHVVN